MSERSDSLREQFGDIDVYLFEQLLRGRIVSGMKVLDAGCGSGRNLIFLTVYSSGPSSRKRRP
jgi:ubiquinone/menaquinone biosynthesis C-methylase UbiE